MDVLFSEDRSRKRAGNATANFATVNRLALNLLKSDNAAKAILTRKRKWLGQQYLESLLARLKM